MSASDVSDSPVPWVAEQIRRYVETGGRSRPGMNDLLLTTRGRRSGRLRRMMLVYLADGPRLVVAASNAGSAAHPAWYLNLLDEPRVRLQVGPETFAAVATAAAGSERLDLWARFVTAMPQYAAYQAAAGRDIPVVVLTRVADHSAGPLGHAL